MEQQEYCPACGALLERGGCKYCSAPPALFCNGVIIWLEWSDQAGIRLAHVQRVTALEERKQQSNGTL